jgi:hypothetical protein
MVLRGLDPTGHGYYGAKRGKRKHKGLDLLADPGVTIYAPIDGEITKHGQVYKTEITDQFKYIEITGPIYRVRILYCGPEITVGLNVHRCQAIGAVQDVAGFWGGSMKNHAHLEIYKHGLLTDPEPLIENYKILSY